MKKKTFTLLELVIVLLILGALTTMAIGQYLDSQKLSRRSIFESNINEIAKALSVYKSNSILYGNQTNSYPISLADSQFKALFKQEPINPYTGKSMLSSASADSGIQYQSDGTSYSICIVQQDVDDINNNGRIDDPLPVTSYPACTSTIQPPPSSEYVVTVVTFPSGAGSPSATPNPAYEGQTVTLSANPGACYNFSSWSSSDATLASTTASVTTFTMPAKNVIATANYTIKTYTINASAGTGGSISPSGQTTVDCGGSKEYTITPSTGYVIDSVIVDGINVGAVSSYTFSNVTSNHTIVANFRLDGVTYFSEGFDDTSSLNNWDYTNASINDGALCMWGYVGGAGSGTGVSARSKILVSPPNPNSFVLEAYIKTSYDVEMWLTLTSTSGDSIRVGYAYEKLRLQAPDFTGKSSGAVARPVAWMRVKLVVKGSQIAAYIGDVEIIAGSTSYTFLPGYISLEMWRYVRGEFNGCFDNVKLTSPAP